MTQFFSIIEDHIKCIQSLHKAHDSIDAAGKLLSETILGGRKILICGNGGSAADSQHFAAELSGRFEKERRGLPAIALTTDSSVLTAVANDYGFDRVFSRQVEALGSNGDLLLGISTSGNSENVLQAVQAAHKQGMTTIALIGKDGGSLKKVAQRSVIVKNQTTARIQEAHLLILHHWAGQIETLCMNLDK